MKGVSSIFSEISGAKVRHLMGACLIDSSGTTAESKNSDSEQFDKSQIIINKLKPQKSTKSEFQYEKTHLILNPARNFTGSVKSQNQTEILFNGQRGIDFKFLRCPQDAQFRFFLILLPRRKFAAIRTSVFTIIFAIIIVIVFTCAVG